MLGDKSISELVGQRRIIMLVSGFSKCSKSHKFASKCIIFTCHDVDLYND